MLYDFCVVWGVVIMGLFCIWKDISVIVVGKNVFVLNVVWLLNDSGLWLFK